VLPPGTQLWKLSSGGRDSLGLSCTEEGLFLGRTALIKRRAQGYAVRAPADLERLLARAYGAGVAVDRVMPGFRAVAAALADRNLCMAQIAAVHLRLPDLPDDIARGSLEAEDRLIQSTRGDDRLARGGWDPAEHPRAGVPPNPGWFAPTGSEQAPVQVAQGDEEERAPEELLDPMAPVRQAQWEAAIATLRRIDPKNLNLTHFSNPGSTPSQEALDRLDAAVEAAAIKRVTDKVMPGGVPIGQPGTSEEIRVLPGGAQTAQELFNYLRVGGTVHTSTPNMIVIRLPYDAGFITLRHVSGSMYPAIDINVPSVSFEKIHFP
jgi:hypothetical protein